MARYRQYGIIAGMHVIKLTPQDAKDLNLKVGDLIDIEDAVRKTSISKDMAKTLKVKR
jgi:anaerobic selenocysteine-containing dehydrogenase